MPTPASLSTKNLGERRWQPPYASKMASRNQAEIRISFKRQLALDLSLHNYDLAQARRKKLTTIKPLFSKAA
ncbi:hypothetical protein GOB94_12160 [Granulicella sp. 5B5]|uniref:hypothetical protein n=1 Tax=Granulicella sp. 5B5 TaxID=1617967 RepID=UPI0015F5318D|nr:hypothetical protein [Granulicella sp. 5B5]QMV19351.1 hypothetical protein GOB94_12160 [Granulicella sp. 5B5]